MKPGATHNRRLHVNGFHVRMSLVSLGTRDTTRILCASIALEGCAHQPFEQTATGGNLHHVDTAYTHFQSNDVLA